MTSEGSRDSGIERAIRRLDRVATLLDQRIAHRLSHAGAQAGGLVDADRARLAAELDAARARERDLEAAGAEASAALADAIAQLQSALAEQDDDDEKEG